MFADIQQGHLCVSAENYDTTLGFNPIYNFIFQTMHDNDHYRTHSDFSWKGKSQPTMPPQNLRQV
ncbi:hypothetical protein [Argonema galeatum]|uniref:hypothetical protein n=1 Tax=Argonema galeatum TaxID=2942762 RepID=UPI002012F1EE|nr:hypothetical protein [Argonema galeatum]MCL1468461.1 hypothetical protein [Argonema galeatum A003/A1]